MIEASEDVENTEAQIVREHLHTCDAGRHGEVRLIAAKHGLNHAAIEKRNAHEGIGAALAQTFDNDSLADQTGAAAVDAPARGHTLLLGHAFGCRLCDATLR